MQIHRSAARGDIAGVRRQLAKGVPVDAVATDPRLEGRTPLAVACEDRRAGADMVRFLLENGADPNRISGPHDRPPLKGAARSGSLEKVRALLDAKADARHVATHGYTALIGVTDVPVIELLAAAGCPLDAVTKHHESALSVASHAGAFDAVRALLDAGADPKPLKWTELMTALVFGTREAVATILDAGADLKAKDRWSRTPWLLSLVVGDVPKAELLLSRGAVLSETGNCGATNLMHAVGYYDALGHPDMVRWLLAQGADVNATNEFSETALIAAAECGDAEAVRLLLAAGAKLDHEDQVATRAISAARTVEAAKVLRDAGADINFVDGQGSCLLKSAARRGDIPFLKALLEWGADVEATSTGDTALHEAVMEDQLECIRLLLPKAHVDAQDVDGRTPLFFAKSTEAVELLIQAHADVNAKAWDRTVLASHDDPNIRELLVKAGAKE